MATIQQLEQQRASLLILLNDLQSQLATTQQRNPTLAAGIQSRIIQVQNDLDLVNNQIAQLRGPIISSGDIVNDDAYATTENSSSQHPTFGPLQVDAQGRVISVPTNTSGTNAEPAVTGNNVDTGTNAPVRTLTNTQGTFAGNNNIGSGLLATPGFNPSTNASGPGFVTTTTPGVGANNDDTASGKNATRIEIDNAFVQQQIIPQSNVLDQYASYTYVISVYLMTLQAFQAMVNSGQKNLSGATLLFQSGGGQGDYGAGRNPYFSNDYYIDRVELLSTIQGKGTGSAHNVATIKMNVVEPNGITLLQNLDLAVAGYLGGVDKKEKNYQAENYLMTIKFYGYDSNGNLVRGGRPNTGITDPNAFVEKWYPMRINNIKYRIANKLVEYEIEATPSQYDINVGSNRGTIPYNMELSGITVKDALAGPIIYSTGQDAVTTGTNTPAGTVGVAPGVSSVVAQMASGAGSTATGTTAPPKASAAPTAKQTIKQGLMESLNAYQANLVKQGNYAIADQYNVEFVSSAIENAKIKRVGNEKNQTANNNSKNAADQKLPEKQSVDTSSRNVSIVAGTQIVQAIDKILRNSTYLEDQQLFKINETSQTKEPNGTPGKNVAWYKISMRAEPIGYDTKRNDYAYRITYVISAYKVAELVSPWFPLPTYNGTHKQYKYWFTGENTSVLSYEIDYKSQYALVMSGGTSRALQEGISNANTLQRFIYQPLSGQNNQGAKGRTNEPAANAADYFYNPGDLGVAKLSIVGDPAWLQQGEAFALPKRTNWNFNPFLADGTINFDSQEVLFEVAFNAPADYNLNTGLIDPNSPNYTNAPQGLSTQNAQSFVYKAVQVTSEFNKGKFTQSLMGSLLRFRPDQIATINNQTQTDVTAQALRTASQLRVNPSNLLAGAALIPYVSTLNNIPGQPNLGQNIAFGINALAGSVLGSSPTRPSATATNPTTVGGVNVGIPSLATPGINPNAGATTVTGTTQSMAASDDSGISTATNTPTDLNNFFG